MARGMTTYAELFPRLVGGLTAAYGLAVAVRPEVLAGPCELTDEHGQVAPSTRVVTSAMGARDALTGLAMTLAPSDHALRTAIAVRSTIDFADATLMGATLPTARARRKAALVAGAWGTLSALTALGTRRAR